MSLRDWFAGQALVGMLANRVTTQEARDYAADHALTEFRVAADWAYLQADAMLAARKESTRC